MRGAGAAQKLLVTCAAIAAQVATACKAPDERIAPFAQRWAAADFAGAEAEIDKLVAEEAGVDVALVCESRGLAEEIDPGKGDTFLFLLEKSQARLAAGDLDASIDLMRRGRDVLVARWNDADVAGWIAGGIADDTFLEYRGADYEHVLTPALLAIVDLLEGGQDCYAYALQVGEAQDRILGSTFGENVGANGAGYNPRKQYQRVAIGAYVEGLVREREGYTSEAFKAYERARAFGGTVPVVEAACERTTNGAYAAPRHGVVHVVRFAGRGPRLVQGTSPVTDFALSLAMWTAIFAGDNIGTIGQAPVPVPVVHLADPHVPELDVRADGRPLGETSTLLDVGAVAAQQIEANMPWILARAAIRRTAKAVAAKVVQDSVDQNNQDDALGLFAGLLTNVALTIGENADTRNWTALPARIQVGRFELPEGKHLLELGATMQVDVNVAAGKDSIVVIVQPDIAQAGAVVVDVYSRVVTPAPAAAPEPETVPKP